MEKPRKIYQVHRENQRERILEVAEALFLRDGIDGVTLSQVAQAARISRVTLYEYFPNKQEIAWAVFQQVMLNLQNNLGPRLSPAAESGWRRLERFFSLMVESLETNPDDQRFVALFNYLYARASDGQEFGDHEFAGGQKSDDGHDVSGEPGAGNSPGFARGPAPTAGQNGSGQAPAGSPRFRSPARMRQILEQDARPGAYGFLRQLVTAGVADGSVRADVDPGLAAAAIGNLLAGMSSRFALLGAAVREEYGYSVMALYREVCATYLRGLRADSYLEKGNGRVDG